jgi:hypothetical protein
VIDLRKPLEAIPGLLLLAALILFGVTIGVSLALGFSWVKMNDSVANFLGGVVGAALGSALAVIGAVYIQVLQRRAELTAPLNELSLRLQSLRAALVMLKVRLEEPGHEGQPSSVWPESLIVQVKSLQRAFEQFPYYPPLSHATNTRITGLRLGSINFLQWIEADVASTPEKDGSVDPPAARRERSLQSLQLVLTPVESFLDEVLKEIGARKR